MIARYESERLGCVTLRTEGTCVSNSIHYLDDIEETENLASANVSTAYKSINC